MNIEQTPNWGGGGNALYSKQNLKPYILCFLSILCIHFGIASYQPFIDTALILLCGGIIAIIIDNNGDLKTSLYKSRFLIISVALAGISYKITLDILKKLGTAHAVYNNQMISLTEMPERILFIIKTTFSNLFTYQYAFMPLSITYVFLAFLVLLIVLICALSLKKRAKFAIFILLILSLFATLTHIVLSKTLTNSALLDFYGIVFWRTIIVALVFRLSFEFARNGQIMRNVGYILGIIALWLCIVCDLHAQRMQKLAFDAHNVIINRAVAKIEENENFSYDKKYYFVMFGDIANMRQRYGAPYFDTLPKDRIAGSGRGLGGYGTLIPTWSPIIAFEFYMPKSISKGSFDDNIETFKESKILQNLISRLHKAKILDKLQPFPHKDSIVIFEDIIVFVASMGNLDKIRHLAKTLDDKGALQ